MKTIILLLLGSTLAIVQADDSEDKALLTREVASYAITLRELLDENWTVQSKENEIIITSKFDVFFIGAISRPGPEFSDKISREELLKQTKPEKHVIRLCFKNRMPREEYERRRSVGQKIVDHLNSGTDSKSEWGGLFRQFQGLKLPRYLGTNDVYAELPIGFGVGTYPPKAYQKVGGAKQILEVILHHEIKVFD